MENMNHMNTFTESFMAHGYCYNWIPELVRLQVISNATIAIAYFMIPIGLRYFTYKRKDLAFKWMFILFSIFIASCGTTHIMDIIIIWYPYYWLDGIIKAITGMASIATAILLIPLIPKAIALPSPEQLRVEINERRKTEEELRKTQQELRKINDELEQRVQERTSQLTTANEHLHQEIHERKKYELDLKRANEDLQQFAYVASHDLQEPLRMISNYTRLIQIRYKDKLDSDGNEFINFAMDGAKRMSSLITDLLNFSRVVTHNQEVTEQNLNNIINNAIANLELSIKDNNVVITHTDLPVLKIEANQMLQVFQNLISNAVKYKSKNIHISAKENENEWIFSVNDDGIGIEEQYTKRIFIIFQRLHTKKEYEGTGMGLAICKRIIEHNGGKIWVESKFNIGSTFYFTIPK